MLLAELDIDDLNMDKSGFGLENGLPYCNTKFCLALLTRELARRSAVHTYAFCPGMVNTPITTSKDIALGLKIVYGTMRSSFSSSADQVNIGGRRTHCDLVLGYALPFKFLNFYADYFQAASEFVMYCALEKSIKEETGQVYRFRKPFHEANEKLDGELAKRLWEKSSELVRLNERLARIK